MNEEEHGRRLAALMSASTGEVDERTASRLRAAREAALAAHRPSRAGRRSASVTLWRTALAAAAVGLVLVVLGDLSGVMIDGGEAEELDAALLADDLPIDAYLDQDFKTWLEQG